MASILRGLGSEEFALQQQTSTARELAAPRA